MEVGTCLVSRTGTQSFQWWIHSSCIWREISRGFCPTRRHTFIIIWHSFQQNLDIGRNCDKNQDHPKCTQVQSWLENTWNQLKDLFNGSERDYMMEKFSA